MSPRKQIPDDDYMPDLKEIARPEGEEIIPEIERLGNIDEEFDELSR